MSEIRPANITPLLPCKSLNVAPGGTPVDQEAELVLGQFALHRTGLLVLGRPSLAAYEDCFSKLKAMQDCVQFWLGDLYLAVERDYGEDGFQIFDELDYERRTIGNFARVARLVPLARRRAELKFGHHDCLACLPPVDQETLLDEAVREGLTVRQLRRRVREVRGENPRPPLGQKLARLAQSWLEDVEKMAPECAGELGQIMTWYGLLDEG